MFTVTARKGGSNRRHPRPWPDQRPPNESFQAGAECLGLAGMHLVNLIPTDSPTRELFCFSRAAELHGEQFVLDLYKRLFSIDRSLTARDVQRCAKEHTLVENIKDKFHLYGPVGWKGIPYAWFLHYEYIFQ